MLNLKVIPVIDLLNGLVVHAARGERSSYKILRSPYCPDSQLVSAVQGFHEGFGFDRFYVADLDSITRKGNNINKIQEVINQFGARIWLDPGISSFEDLNELELLDVEKFVVGSETYNKINGLKEIFNNIHEKNILFSLDMKEGKVLTPDPLYREKDLQVIVNEVVCNNINQLIILNLTGVGTHNGISDEPVFNLPSQFPKIEFYYGGGIKSMDDLHLLEQNGFSGALVGTAFHKGTIKKSDLDRFCTS